MLDWKTLQRLKLLIRMQSRCSEVCQRVEEKITDSAQKEVLQAVNKDHERQIKALHSAATIAGSKITSDMLLPEPGISKHALDALEQNISDTTRVDACLQWVEHVVEAYAEALAEKHPPDIHKLFELHRAIELRHIASLRSLMHKK